jgi:uncharacterized repeat protein (TIGR01451 family)
MNIIDRLRYSIAISIIILCVLSVTAIPSFNNKAFAQSNQSPLSQSAVIFKNVTVDTNPEPNKPFKINATVSVSDIQRRHVLLSLAAPDQISVTGSGIIDLGDISSGNGERVATWTVIAARSGSYPLNLTAYSSSTNVGSITNNFQSNSFLFDVSIGSLKSLIISKVNLPGNLLPNNIFTATMALKNTGTVPANNIIAQVSVPSGLHLIGNTALNILSVKPGEELPISWKIKSETPGSFPISLNYSSTNAGSGSIVATANVGQPIITDVRPYNVLLAGSDLSSSIVGPGDKNLPLNITLVNDGTLPIVNMTATLELSEPFFWSYIQNGATTAIESQTQTFYIGSIKSRQLDSAYYFINVRKTATPNTYTNHLKISFSDGKQQYQRIYEIPISISPNIALSVAAHAAKIIPGYYTPITFDIINKGQVALHSIKLSSTPAPSSFISPPSTSPTVSTSALAPTSPISSSFTSAAVTGGSPYLSIDTPYWVGDLAVGETKSTMLKIYMPRETLIQTPLPITLNYQANGKNYSETHLVGVEVMSKPAFQVHDVRVFPTLSFPGDLNTRMDLNIINSGYGIADNVTTLLNLPHGLSPAFGNATTGYFGRILPNQNFTASYFVNVDSNTKSANYPLTLSIDYNNNRYNNGKTQLHTSFLVSPKAQFEVVDVADSNKLYPGASNVPLRIALKNTGSAIAQTIITKLLGGNSIPGVRSPLQTGVGSTENVGYVLPGQVFTATYIVNADPSTTTPGRQIASVQIDWKQQGGVGTAEIAANTFTQTLPITYNVAEGPPYLLYYNGIPLMYIAIAVIITIILIVFIVARRKRIHAINVNSQVPANVGENHPINVNSQVPANVGEKKSPARIFGAIGNNKKDKEYS